MDGPFCISNVVILDKKALELPDHLQNLKMHQRLMLKITQVFEENQIPFKMVNDCKLQIKNKLELEIRQHKALVKATKSSETVAFLLHFGTGFDEVMLEGQSLK